MSKRNTRGQRRFSNAVPVNNAARKASGLPPLPKGTDPFDAVIEAMGGEAAMMRKFEEASARLDAEEARDTARRANPPARESQAIAKVGGQAKFDQLCHERVNQIILAEEARIRRQHHVIPRIMPNERIRTQARKDVIASVLGPVKRGGKR